MAKKVIRLTESDLQNMIKKSVNRILKEEYSWDEQQEDLRKQAQVKKMAIEALNKYGFKDIWGDTSNSLYFNVELNSMDEEEKIEQIVSRALGCNVGYFGGVQVQSETRLGGIHPYAKVYLPTWNNCSKFQSF